MRYRHHDAINLSAAGPVLCKKDCVRQHYAKMVQPKRIHWTPHLYSHLGQCGIQAVPPPDNPLSALNDQMSGWPCFWFRVAPKNDDVLFYCYYYYYYSIFSSVLLILESERCIACFFCLFIKIIFITIFIIILLLLLIFFFKLCIRTCNMFSCIQCIRCISPFDSLFLHL